MAFDAFLKIEGIDGESTDDKHKKEIEVLSYHWSIAQTRSGSASFRRIIDGRTGEF